MTRLYGPDCGPPCVNTVCRAAHCCRLPQQVAIELGAAGAAVCHCARWPAGLGSHQQRTFQKPHSAASRRDSMLCIQNLLDAGQRGRRFLATIRRIWLDKPPFSGVAGLSTLLAYRCLVEYAQRRLVQGRTKGTSRRSDDGGTRLRAWQLGPDVFHHLQVHVSVS